MAVRDVAYLAYSCIRMHAAFWESDETSKETAEAIGLSKEELGMAFQAIAALGSTREVREDGSVVIAWPEVKEKGQDRRA